MTQVHVRRDREQFIWNEVEDGRFVEEFWKLEENAIGETEWQLYHTVSTIDREQVEELADILVNEAGFERVA